MSKLTNNYSYGSVVPIHNRDPTKFQHQGYGTLLMEEAERIAREEHKSTKISVISGVGTRDYYRKLGYGMSFKLRKEQMLKKKKKLRSFFGKWFGLMFFFCFKLELDGPYMSKNLV